MTAQIADTVIYKQEKYQLIGVKGEGLPLPDDYGMEPVMMSTACYQGYYLQFTVRDDQIRWTAMTIRVEDGHYKPVGKVMPVIRDYEAEYVKLNLFTRFSGTLLIAKDFIEAMYVHMGYQKPISFETVIEFQVEDGYITQTTDYSEKFANLREELRKPRPKSDEDELSLRQRGMNSITYMFSLDYDW